MNPNLDAPAKMRPPIRRRPRITAAQALHLYLTILGWLLWMVVVGYFSLRATSRTLSINLAFSAFIAVLTFVDFYGLWLVIGRWRALRTPAPAAAGKGEGEGSAESAAPVEGGAEPDPREETRVGSSPVIEKGLFRSLSGPPGRLKRQVAWMGAAAAATAVAILATGATGRPIFLPGTGTIKGSVALALSLWIFIEPITKVEDGKSRESAIVAKAALGLGLLCFASDFYFPWFGAAGIAAGAAAVVMGRRAAGIYAAFISAAAFALQWWGYTIQ